MPSDQETAPGTSTPGTAAASADAVAPMVFAENLVKIYKSTEIEVVALQGLDLTVAEGELMAIIGNSGSGKSTLLNIVGGLDIPSAGRIEVAGRNLVKFTDADFISFRRDVVGFVWQNVARNLVPYLDALQNVEMPMFLAGTRDRRQRARELLGMVGLSHRIHSRLGELSGGEQQRVAIAIGMANLPRLLLADEPTGNVDSATAGTIFQAFRTLNKSYGVTVMIVTHDRRISRAVDRVVAIRDGRNSSEFIRRAPTAEAGIATEKGLPGSSIVETDTHEELAVLDRAGRLQLPREYLDALGLSGKDKIKVSLDGKKIVLTPPVVPGEAPGTAATDAVSGDPGARDAGGGAADKDSSKGETT
jgi:ABC-type lipoprotein export system ATPase subunit